MRVLIDRLIELFKWPFAVYMLFSIPAYTQSIYSFSFTSLKFVSLIGGFFLFFISRSMSDKEFKASLEIAAHEVTHAFFALLTLHKVIKIQVDEDNKGGSMSFEGTGNWLIIIAPYFFPFFAFLFMIGVTFYTKYFPTNFTANLIISGMLGFLLGYHMDVVGSQIHEKQTDLPKVSYTFCIMFLPSANLWAIGSILAFNSRGWEGLLLYQKLINMLNANNWNTLINFF